MTTIAADRKCMASDRKLTCGETAYQVVKIRRIGRAIVGCSGTSSAASKFMRWLAEGKDPDSIPRFGKDDELNALVLTPAGLFLFDIACEPDEIVEGRCAIGSGQQAALAAMRKYNASPKDAVDAACLADNGTAGPIDVLYLDA